MRWFTAAHIAAISADKIDAFSGDQIGSLTVGAFAGFTYEQMLNMSTTILRNNVDPLKQLFLTPAAIAGIDAAFLGTDWED